MANFKITISDVKGKSIIKELKDSDANPLLGLTVGQETDAALVGLQGKLKITGGSDKSGVPMRGDVLGGTRKRVLIAQGVGLQDTEKGLRKRKLLRGNTISEEIYQINTKFDGEIKIEKPKEEENEMYQQFQSVIAIVEKLSDMVKLIDYLEDQNWYKY